MRGGAQSPMRLKSGGSKLTEEQPPCSTPAALKERGHSIAGNSG